MDHTSSVAWMREPYQFQEEAASTPLEDIPAIDPRLVRRLRERGFPSLFPVQAAVWRHLVAPGTADHDMCVTAPTGSGKTLSYALPIVQMLAKRNVRRLRALVILPTRDLAAQVKEVFDMIAPAVGLSVCLICGQGSIKEEAEMLLDSSEVQEDPYRYFTSTLWESKHLLSTGMNSSANMSRAEPVNSHRQREGVQSRVDILIATPGRLVDHIKQTPGFSLKHLRFLVVDEVDRLLRQSYQDWLPLVLHGVGEAGGGGGERRGLGAPSLVSGFGLPPSRSIKLAFSATLTKDPSKLGRLFLHRPLFIAPLPSAPSAGKKTKPGEEEKDKRYKLPKSLQEFKIVCSAEEKPLFLVALLNQLSGHGAQSEGYHPIDDDNHPNDSENLIVARQRPDVCLVSEKGGTKQINGAPKTLVFAASVQAAHRLFLLLSHFRGLRLTVQQYSSLQTQKKRSLALADFKAGRVDVLIASDAMTRGMDVECVDNVISYDVPSYAKTYVHRAGRTARAGKGGRKFTLLRKEQVKHFKGMLRKLDNNFCKDFRVPQDAIQSLTPSFVAALEHLKQLVEEEAP